MRLRNPLVVPPPFAESAGVMSFGPYLDLAGRLAPRTPLEAAPLGSAEELLAVRAGLCDSGVDLSRERLVRHVASLVANAHAFLALPVPPAVLHLVENLAIARLLDGADVWAGMAALVTNEKLASFGVATISVLVA